MSIEDARRVLDEVGVLRHRSDLDLLVFFVRHPRTLLTSEQLAAFLGYEIAQIADSLEMLLEAKLLTRSQNPSHAARLYVFAPRGISGGWLPLLSQLASTRPGRLALLAALSDRRETGAAGPVARSTRVRTELRRPRPFLVRGSPDVTRGSKAG